MKRVILIGVVVVAMASVTAYAQMQHDQSPGQSGPSMMHEHMQKLMHGKHGKMHGGMRGGQADAHDRHVEGDGHQASGEPRGDRGPASAAFLAINKKMHEEMSITFTGNADRDFIAGMIPHHQGAVEMAKVVLAFGSDPVIRKLAESIIQAQESEIAMMRAWLERNVR